VFIDAILVEVRDAQVGNRPFYAAIGVTLDGEKDVLGVGRRRRRRREVLDEGLTDLRNAASRTCSSSATASKACPRS
jgi:transposase-like protein